MLPAKYMLPEELWPDCRDQGKLDICVAMAITAVMQIIYYKRTGKREQFSPTFAAGVWRDAINRRMKSLVPETALKYAIELGCPFTKDLSVMMQNPEAYDYVEAHPELWDKAKENKLIESFEVLNAGSREDRVLQIKNALVEELPVVATVKEKTSGHCVPIIGWDDDKEVFYVINSWGDKGGAKGLDSYKYEELKRGYKIKPCEEKEEVKIMGNSSLVDFVKISPYKNSPRNHAIDTVTIHCYVGQASVEEMGEEFQSGEHSCNYGIAYDGKIALIVDEGDRSWCSSSRENDNRAVTIEVACEPNHPYEVNEAAYKSLINLLADICKRNGIKKLLWKGDKSLIGQVEEQNMTVHRWFANKACPGEWLYERHEEIAEEVNKLLKEDKFTDIENHYAREDINELAEAGILKGRGDGTFGPDEFITRGDMAIMMNRLRKEMK